MALYSWFNHKRSHNKVSSNKKLSYLANSKKMLTNIGYVWPAIKKGTDTNNELNQQNIT